jgi:hypothetical protein
MEEKQIQEKKYENVTLFFEWKYKAYGLHWKRYYEQPITYTGRSKMTVSGTMNEIKEKLKQYVIDSCRPDVLQTYEWDTEKSGEELDYEVIKLYNVREATIWSELEDF